MIPLPYKLLGAIGGGLLLILSSYFYGHHIASLSYEVHIAKQAVQAQKLIADRQAANAALEVSRAEFNNQLEADHAKATADIADARNEFDRQLAIRLRQPVRGPSCGAPGTAAPANTGGAAPVTPDAGIWLSEQSLRDLGDSAAQADQLKAYAMACQSWAVSVGR